MKRIISIFLALTLILTMVGVFSSCGEMPTPTASASPSPYPTAEPSYKDQFGLELLQPGTYRLLSGEENNDEIKNVIYLIGDGMGFANIEASRWYNFETVTKESLFAMETLPFKGIVTTWSKDTLLSVDETGAFNGSPTDSAAAGTALSCGIKTDNYKVAVSSDGLNLTSILTAAIQKGMKTGVLTTKPITDATPAVFIAHAAYRSQPYELWTELMDCGADVLLGAQPSTDERYNEALALAEKDGYHIAKTKDSFMNSTSDKLFGVLDIYKKREIPLADATRKALDVLNNDNGFFVMIEGGAIDNEAHNNEMAKMCNQFIDFDNAVKVAIDFANNNEGTLVIVTADHETGGIIMPETVTSQSEVTDDLFTSTEHTTNNVPIFAFGPKAHIIANGNNIDNTYIPQFIATELGLDISANFNGDCYGDKEATIIELTKSGSLKTLLSGSNKKIKIISKGAPLNEADLKAIVDFKATFVDLRFAEIENRVLSTSFAKSSSMDTILLPFNLKEIADGAFKNCSKLQNVVISYNTKVIGKEAFVGSALQVLNLPFSITEIPDNMATNLSSITEITIPLTVTQIGSDAFFGLTALETVYVKNETPATLIATDGEYKNFDTSNENFKIVVPNKTLDAYKNAEGWSAFAEFMVEAEG